MTATALTAAQAGLISCETCGLLSRPARYGRAGLLPALRRGTRVAPPPVYPVHLGARHRRGDLLHPREHSAGAQHDHARVLRVRHHHGRGRVPFTSGSWPLALIVLIASVMVPLGKLVALSYLLITVQRGSITSNHERTRLYRMVEFIGRWSMLDVFVDTFTVALVQLQPLMSVAPGPGVLFFAAVVVLTMIAAESFDPRLIWDAGREQGGSAWLKYRSRQPAAGHDRAEEAHAGLDHLDHSDLRRSGGHRDRDPSNLERGPDDYHRVQGR